MRRVILLLVGLGACATTTTERLNLPPLQTESYVDLQRYVGKWYEIARFPHEFQENCTATTATYSLREDGRIDVLNQCHLGSPNGPLDATDGVARVVNEKTNAKLEVSFFWPFWGDYWILDVGPNYDYAVVGHPSRDYLWILAREPSMPAELYQRITRNLAERGYELERLERTVWPNHGGARESPP